MPVAQISGTLFIFLIMRLKFFFIVFIPLLILVLGFSWFNAGGRAGYTGSPGEITCAGCHGQYPLNSGIGMMQIETNLPNHQYAPGHTYQINVKIKHVGKSLFGFGLESLDTSNSSVGAFVVTDPVRTHVVNALNGRPNMTHKANGGASVDSALFSFDWTAPLSDVGDVTFYFSGNAADGNGSTSGDYIYAGSYSVSYSENASNPVLQQPISKFTVYTNANRQITVNYGLNQSSNVSIALLTTHGQWMYHMSSVLKEAGNHILSIPEIPLQSGVYIMYLMADRQIISKKFLWTN